MANQFRIVTMVVLFFFFQLSNTDAGESTAPRLGLTGAEKKWLKAHPVIRAANETDWPPFDFNESGEPRGFAVDYLNLLAEKIGIKIDYVYGYTWNDLVALFKKKEIDLMPVFYKNKEREAFTLYTASYYKGKLGVFTNMDGQSYGLVGRRVGMERGHGSIPLVKKLVPGIQIIEVDYKTDLVRRLATDQLDAIIGNPFVFYYLARESQISNIRLSDYIPLSHKEQNETSLHMGIRNDWPILHRIIQKAMDNVSDAEMRAIENKWADVEIVEPIDWTPFLYGLFLICVIVLFLLWHNRKLQKMVRIKTRELRDINETLELKIQERTRTLNLQNIHLTKTVQEIKTLKGLLPICSSCKKIRDDKGYWNQIESYIQMHSEAEFSHGVCPDCSDKLYGNQQWYIEMKKEEGKE